MKIKGVKKLSLRQENFEIKRGKENNFNLLLTALPIGTLERVEKALPAPKPPKNGFCRNDKDGKFIRDTAGRPIPYFDTQNQDYIEKEKRIGSLQNVMFTYLGLSKDPSIEWASKRENFKSDEEFYGAIENELKDAGFSMGEVGKITDKIMSVSSIGEEQLKEAREDFLLEDQSTEKK